MEHSKNPAEKRDGESVQDQRETRLNRQTTHSRGKKVPVPLLKISSTHSPAFQFLPAIRKRSRIGFRSEVQAAGRELAMRSRDANLYSPNSVL